MHIKDAELTTVKYMLKQHAPGLKVWAFGSRVHGNNLKEFSDLDLAIISNTSIDSSLLDTLKNAFANSNLPFRVDLVDWATTATNFRQIIKSNHEVISEA